MNETDEGKKQKFKNTKKLVDESLMNQSIKTDIQEMINKPQDDPEGIDVKDQEFLETVVELINDGTIDVYVPETIMNKEVYEKVDEEAKGIADFNAVPLLGELRRIKILYDTGKKETFQIKNLVHRVRLTKERLEDKCGDIYII